MASFVCLHLSRTTPRVFELCVPENNATMTSVAGTAVRTVATDATHENTS